MTVGGTFYLHHIEQQGQIELGRIRTALKSLEERNKKTTHKGGHFHEDGTWHAEPHDEQRTEIPSEDIQIDKIETALPEERLGKDYTQWLEKYQKAFAEVTPERHALRDIIRDSPENYAKIQAQLKKIRQMNKKLEAIKEAAPVRQFPERD